MQDFPLSDTPSPDSSLANLGKAHAPRVPRLTSLASPEARGIDPCSLDEPLTAQKMIDEKGGVTVAGIVGILAEK